MPDNYTVVVTRTDGTEARHPFSHEGDARHYLAECQSQGFTTRLIQPTPDEQSGQVFLAWELEVTERYRARVNIVDLPESVQAALATGATILDIVKHPFLGKPGAVPYADEVSDLEEYLSDWEEGPYDEVVLSERTLDVRAMEAQAKQAQAMLAALEEGKS
jgi:cytosine/adenosine deaminase-related metal-dependent hydrolase